MERVHEEEMEERFDALFHDTYQQVVAYCQRRCGSPQDAEEAVANAYQVAWRRFDEFEGADSPQAWLYGVAYKSLANVRRKEQRFAVLRGRLTNIRSTGPPTPEHHLERSSEVERAFQALDKLSPYDQQVIRLAAFEELTYKQIGQVVGKSENAVRSDLYRARRRLRDVYWDNDDPGTEVIP